jgi:CRISPR-associated protein Cmr2
MRDYVSYKVQESSRLIDELERQERIIRESRGGENRTRRDDAERKAQEARDILLSSLPSAASFEYLDVTGRGNAVKFRTRWQEKNRRVNCLEALSGIWGEGVQLYKEVFAAPSIKLALLPSYSFLLQFTFSLAQPYISRDEQSFYIIENPVRKDRVFGLPYIAASSWKGSLRSALWQLGYKDNNADISHLFGNEKSVENQEDFQSGCLQFFPTFFTMKSLEIINPQDRKLRSGSNPIPFESVPEGSEGIFTLLYVPFDQVGNDEKVTRPQVLKELKLTAEGLQAMFLTYGFGAKTRSGFGLAKDGAKGTLSINMAHDAMHFNTFAQLNTNVDTLKKS